VFIYSRLFITSFFGTAYADGAIALQILLFGVLFYTVSLINENIVSGIGKPQIIMNIIVAAAIVNIVLNFILIPLFGINGAAIATMVSYVMMFAFTTIRAARFTEMQLPFYEWGKLLVPTIVFFAVQYLSIFFFSAHWTTAFVTSVVAGLAYLSIALALRLFSVGEIKKLLVRLTH